MWSFLHSPGAMIAALVTVLAIAACFAAPLIAPYNPFDPAQISLWDGKLPPAWAEGGQEQYILGTDNQGRDMLSTILYGGRLSIIVGLAAVFLGMVLGVSLGVISGYVGGATDAIIMRIADVQLTIPGILLAILINGIGRAALPLELREEFAIYVVIIAIGLTDWPQFARVARGATLVEANKEYVQAARVIGLPGWLIMIRHILPNTMRPVLVIATIGLASGRHRRGDALLPRPGHPADDAVAGDADPGRQRVPLLRPLVDHLLPGHRAGRAGLRRQPLGDWMRDALNPKLR